MFTFGKSKKVVNLIIDDYVVRMVENNGKDLTSMSYIAEEPLPSNLIENGKILDDKKFFGFMEELVEEWGIKGKSVRFCVPNPFIIIRNVPITEPVIPEEIKQYITMEIGHTIHFPFTNPVFDVYDMKGTEKVEHVTLLAAPEDDILKYTNVLTDVGLKPVAVDVEALCNYRYFFTYHQPDRHKVYLFLQINVTSIKISIFHNDYMEFFRYESFNLSTADWQAKGKEPISWTYTGDKQHLTGIITDKIDEIDRIMNFYQFSIHQGEKTVTDIVVLGDFPQLAKVKDTISEQYTLPVHTMAAGAFLIHKAMLPTFVPSLGLALKGGFKHGT